MTKSISLKKKLLFVCLALVVIPTVVMYGMIQWLDHELKDDAQEGLTGRAKNFQHLISSQFYERYGDVQAFAMNPGLLTGTRGEIVEHLNYYAAAYGIYDLILLVDKSGRLVATNSKDPSGKDIKTASLYEKSYADAAWFKAALAGQFTEDKENGLSGTFVEQPATDQWISDVYGKPTFGVGFSTVVKNKKGEVIGVLSNRSNFKWVSNEFTSFYGGLKAAGIASAGFLLLGPGNTVYAHYEPQNHNGDTSFVIDENAGKTALKELGYSEEINKNLLEKKEGFSEMKDTVTKRMSVVTYAPFSDHKFARTLNWSVLLEADTGELLHSLHMVERVLYIAMLTLTVLAGLFAALFSSKLGNALSGVITKLQSNSTAVASAAEQIAASSTELSESSTEQASAIQETAASIDQVTAMIRKNSENAAQSQQSSQESNAAAQDGKKAITEMITAIDEIQSSNTSIMKQVEDSNRQIGEIVQLISEIGNKTKVINDIVFQTKLLSFNASVEAARAGEHGKGFSVVAEEVGNLAQMSGNAAKEISSMLENSIQKVESIVQDTKSKVEGLIREGAEKVEKGTKTARVCGNALENILGGVQKVDTMIAEIATASNEQAQGIGEINKAMNQLDQVTSQNTTVAQQSASAAESLNQQSSQLKTVVGELYALLEGKSFTQAKPKPHKAAAPEHTAEQSTTTESVNVVSMDEAKSKKEEKKKQRKQPVAEQSLKQVVGGSSVPSENDPRFEDV